MRSRLFLWIVLAAPLAAHSHLLSSIGAHKLRGDYEHIQFLVNENLRPGATNADGDVIIPADSDPVAAAIRATEAWNESGDSLVHFEPLQITSLQSDPADNSHVIVLEDTPEIRSILGDALALTGVYGTSDGRITDTDILINPHLVLAPGTPPIQFSTTGDPITVDLQSVLTHELGHALGAGHSEFLGSIMYQAEGLSTGIPRGLSTDDRAFLRESYSVAATRGNYGRIQGHVTLPGGGPARNVMVTLIDPETGEALGGLTNSLGIYFLSGVAPGNYFIYAEPLDGPVRASNIYVNSSEVDLDFEPTFVGQGGQASPVSIAAGEVPTVDLQLASREGGVEIDFLARGHAGGSGDFYISYGALEFSPGETADVIVGGVAFDDSIASAEVEILGAGVHVRPGSVHIDPLIRFSDGTKALRFTVDVTAPPQPSMSSIILRLGGSVGTYTGSIVVLPTEPLFLSGDSVVNAAAVRPGPVAVDSWVSIFGSGLADELVAAPAGTLPTALGGTIVTVTDALGIVQPAHLQFVSPTQVNFLMPSILLPGSVLLRVVSNRGVGTVEATVNRLAPGIFSANSSGEGPAAATYLKVTAAGDRSSGFTFDPDTAPRRNTPLDLGAPGDQVYLTFYGTGIRGYSGSARASIGLKSVPVLAAVAQGEFAGLDQVNIGPVPRELIGAGEQTVLFSFDGVFANQVSVNIK